MQRNLLFGQKQSQSTLRALPGIKHSESLVLQKEPGDLALERFQSVNMNYKRNQSLGDIKQDMSLTAESPVRQQKIKDDAAEIAKVTNDMVIVNRFLTQLSQIGENYGKKGGGMLGSRAQRAYIQAKFKNFAELQNEFNDAHSIYSRADLEHAVKPAAEPYVPKEEGRALEEEEHKLQLLQQVFCMTAITPQHEDKPEQSRSNSRQSEETNQRKRRPNTKVTLKPLYDKNQISKRRPKKTARGAGTRTNLTIEAKDSHDIKATTTNWDGTAESLMKEVEANLDQERAANYSVRKMGDNRNCRCYSSAVCRERSRTS